MYYIISPICLEEICKYEKPLKDKYGNRDSNAFYASLQGQEFIKYHPLRIKECNSKESLIECVSLDLNLLSACYNCNLYVYVMSNLYYSRNLKLGPTLYGNFKLYKEMQENKINRLQDEKRYYYGNGNQFNIDILKNLKDINLRTSPLWCYYLTLQTGLVKG